MTESAPLMRHRDVASPVLEVDWALLRLLDETGCQQLQHDLRVEG